MSETTEQNPLRFTGSRDDLESFNRQFLAALDAAPDDGAKLIALAVRAGLSEIAVEVSSIRGFGVAQQKR